MAAHLQETAAAAGAGWEVAPADANVSRTPLDPKRSQRRGPPLASFMMSTDGGALRSFDRNREREHGSLSGSYRLRPKPPSMTFDDRAAHGKADAHATVFGGVERLE